MKKAACIAICLVAVIAIGAIDDLAPQEQLRELRAVNTMLKAQVHALKRRLAAATSKPATRPTSRAEPGTRPAVKVEAGSKAFTVILYEDNPKWWMDLEALAKEVATRQVIQQLEPKHAVNAWLDKNKGFIGKRVRWKLTVSKCEVLTKSKAGENYYRAMNNKADVEAKKVAAEKTLAAPKRTGKNIRTTDAMRQATAIAQRRIRETIAAAERQIRQHEAEAVQYKALMDGEGGTLVTGSIQEPASITVVAAIPGGKKLTTGKKTDVSGKIANTMVGTVGRYGSTVGRYRRPGSAGGSGGLQVALVGQ